MWSIFDLFRRRITAPGSRAKPKRKPLVRQAKPWLEILEDRCVPTASTVSANFNAGAIAAGDTLWFNAAASVSGVGNTYAADVFVTNQTITFSDVKGGVTTPYTLNVPNAELTLIPGTTAATTTFNTTTNSWLTTAPSNLGGNLFMAGYAMSLPSGLGGGDQNVTWSATFTTDTSGVNVNWAWGAAVYTSFTTTYSAVGVKPCDDNKASIYTNADKAGSPENYESHVHTGATGTGSPNYTGTLTGNTNGNATYVPTFVSLAGTVYNDLNADGSDDGSDTGISGVTLTLTGTTTGGQSVSTTTTTAANGTYSFTTSSSTTLLVAGTYQIVETEPTGDLQGTDTVGTVGGTVDGTLGATDTVSSIALTAGQSGTGYNFGELVPTISSSQANFANVAIAPGRTIWFYSVATVTGVGSYPADIFVTNQTITFSDTKSGVTTPYTLTVPNAELTVTPGATTANTTFNTSTNSWLTTAPSGLAGNLFLAGYEMALPSGLGGNDPNVTWTGTFTTDTSGISISWSWASMVYTSFNTTYSSLGIKPCDSSTADPTYPNSDKAGTPESYKSHSTTGATAGSLSGNQNVTPRYTPVYDTLAGIVYNDANNSGVYNSGTDTGISGITVNLTGTNTNGSITATTTTAADGTYSFITDSNGNRLSAGTFEITEIAPAGYYAGSNNIGTVNGTTDGTLVPIDSIGSITLGTGQSGANYNFGNVDPFTQVTPAYPYGTGNDAIAFNESEIMAGASVNLATSTLDFFYTDEHAMTLGVSGVTVTASNGRSTTTNYNIATMPTGQTTASVINPNVGDTTVTGAQAAVDGSGRPLFPSLFVTDITANASNTSGDWQNGGTAIAPTAIYGSWKSYAITVNQETSPATITESGGNDPTANGWSLPAGADPVPSAVQSDNAGYGTEVQWNLNSLYSSGVLIPGHNYRFYFIVHDGDQNKAGGDCGQVAYDFTYRGPATIAGNVYKDVYGNGVDGAGDSGIGGVTVTLTGTTAAGGSVNTSTTTASNGTYTFTTDQNGNLLTGGTYQVAETQPSGYLQGYNTVGLTSWATGFSTALTNITTSGNGSNPGFVHDIVNSVTDNIFAGSGSLDTNSLTKWNSTTGEPAATDDIADAFGANFSDSLTGHNFVLAGVDRYASSAATTVGFWAFQNSVSVNGNGTFSGIHSNGDLFFVVNVTADGASSVAVYEWVGTDATGALTLVTTPVGATYVNVNTNTASVPWTFLDKTGNTSPQAGELLEMGVDLNAIFGLTVPHFVTFLAETRASTATGSALSDFAIGTLKSVSGSFTADGTLIPTDKIGNIIAADGQNGINYNFGEVQPITIAGTVYQDTNGNGVLDNGETGISGVTVSLSGTNNLGAAVTATATTAANGTYSFTTDSTGKLLAPGTYQLVETAPGGTYLAATDTVGTVNGTAVGTAVSSGTIGSITETTGQNGINYNFGHAKAVTIAGTVYQDTNGNGVFDSGEPGIAGVTLTLSGTNTLGQPITATAVTASNGTYSFILDSNSNSLRPGTYQIVETQPSGYLAGATAVGTVGGTTDGSTATLGTIGSIALISAQAGINYNFGDVLPVTVAGTVYQDSNGNGALDSGEPGIAGVTMTLTGTNGLGQAITATATTAANGTYTFTLDSNGNALRPGTYSVTETQPSGYLAGATAVGTVSGTTDGTVVSAGQIGSIALTSGQSGINYNFGDYKAVTFGGTVYQDTNGNGVFDSGEPGIAGVTMTLNGTNGLGQTITATTTTAVGGTYSFTLDSNGNALRPGTYQVTETQPSGYVAGTTAVGTVNGATDGTIVAAGHIGSIVLTSGQTGSNYNFGDVKPITVSGTVYTDTNGTGIYNSGSDAGIGGVTLTLSGTNNVGTAITATATTASNGTYTFTLDSNGNQLRPGTYQVVETQPSGYLLGAATAGTVNGVTDGTVSSATNISSIALTSGQTGISYLFGDVKAVTFGGTVYQDTNGNGVFDSGEPGIAGVTMTLNGTNGLGATITATTTTAAGGTYSFSLDSNGAVLRPGTYQVTETQPSGYLAGATAIGTVNGTADGTIVATGHIGSIILTSAQAGINYNFGDVLPVTIAGTVYQDTNGNGVFDSGEPGIAGVTVTLTGTNGLGQAITATATTIFNGTYSITTDSNGNALRPGTTYKVTETQPSGYVAGATAVGTVSGTTDGTVVSAGQIGSIAMTSGQAGVNYNFGDVKPVTISGIVFQDTNANGVMDSGEPGLVGVTVTLTGTNGLGQAITATTTTGSGGTYSFTTDSNGNSLRPGTAYQVTETLPAGYIAGTAAVGTVSGTTDGAIVSASQIGSIALTSGQAGINYAFADYKAITIGGTVYQDNNGNNVFDAGEPGIAGVTVTLTGINGLGASITATTTTGSNGTYTFSLDSNGNMLKPGTYQVAETQPGGYLAGATAVGTVNGTADGTLGSGTSIGSIGLTSGQGGINYNFGNYQPFTVAGTVYVDLNANGVLDSGETGIAGVTMTLTGTNGLGQPITATTTTAANGTYSFTTDSNGHVLVPGTYQIAETPPSGYLQGLNTVGTMNGTTDGTLVPVNQIGSIALTSGQSGINYNFGWVTPVTVAGLVYLDPNGAGVLVAGDSGMANVTVTLTGINILGQSVTATTTTGTGGTYSFTTDSNGKSLSPGTYQLADTDPSGYVQVAANVGSVNGANVGTEAASGLINAIVLPSGANGINYDFGLSIPGAVTGYLYVDSAGDQTFDNGDPALANQTVTLTGTDKFGNAVNTTTMTNANGYYIFTGLNPGTYQITVTVPGILYNADAADVGTVNGVTVGIANPSGLAIAQVILTYSNVGLNYDFGFTQSLNVV